jgi:hypothetical protein
MYLAQHFFIRRPTPEFRVKGELQKAWYSVLDLCVKYVERLCLVSVSPIMSMFLSVKSSITCLDLVRSFRLCTLCVAMVKVFPEMIVFETASGMFNESVRFKSTFCAFVCLFFLKSSFKLLISVSVSRCVGYDVVISSVVSIVTAREDEGMSDSPGADIRSGWELESSHESLNWRICYQ